MFTNGRAASAEDGDSKTAGSPTNVRRDSVIVRAIERMEGEPWKRDAKLRTIVQRHLERLAEGDEDSRTRFFELVRKLHPPNMEQRLMSMIIDAPSDAAGVRAIEELLKMKEGWRPIFDHTHRVAKQYRDAEAGQRFTPSDIERDVRFAKRLGLHGDKFSREMNTFLLKTKNVPYDVASVAVRGLVRSKPGVQVLIAQAKSEQLPSEVRGLAGDLISVSNFNDMKATAANVLPPTVLDQKVPLQSLDKLVALRGDAKRGGELFRTKATCANCHRVGGSGKEVGPDLTEIGSKLSREAMFVSILQPSAGISHNYENHLALTVDGQSITGVLVNETEGRVTLRTAEAIDRTIDRDDLEIFKKSPKSIMPENLHLLTGEQGLVDIVTYMQTLKKQP
ncbi:MAG: c-type cytochrome [Planctomycetota bacterium]